MNKLNFESLSHCEGNRRQIVGKNKASIANSYKMGKKIPNIFSEKIPTPQYT